MIVKPIDLAEYSAFYDSLYANPIQSPAMYERMKEMNRNPVIYGGFVDGRLVIAMICGFYRYRRFTRYIYMPYGYISTQPGNTEWVLEFMKGIARHLRFSNVTAIRFETTVETGKLDPSFQMQYDEIDNRSFRRDLLKGGFIANEPGNQPVISGQPRQVALIDLVELENWHGYADETTRAVRRKTRDELLKAMDAKTRRLIRQSEVPYVKIEETDEETLHRLGKLSGEHQNYTFVDLSVLKGTRRAYQDQARIKLAYLDVPEYLHWAETKCEELKQEIETCREKNTKRSLARIRDLEDSLKKNESSLQEAKDLSDQGLVKVPLAASMFLYSGKMVDYFWSGMDRTYGKHNGTLRLLWDTMLEASEKGAWTFNLLGVAGTYQKSDAENFGLVSFKTGLGARIAEYTGLMYYPIHPASWNRKLVQKMADELSE